MTVSRMQQNSGGKLNNRNFRKGNELIVFVFPIMCFISSQNSFHMLTICMIFGK